MKFLEVPFSIHLLLIFMCLYQALKFIHLSHPLGFSSPNQAAIILSAKVTLQGLTNSVKYWKLSCSSLCFCSDICQSLDSDLRMDFCYGTARKSPERHGTGAEKSDDSGTIPKCGHLCLPQPRKIGGSFRPEGLPRMHDRLKLRSHTLYKSCRMSNSQNDSFPPFHADNVIQCPQFLTCLGMLFGA